MKNHVVAEVLRLRADLADLNRTISNFEGIALKRGKSGSSAGGSAAGLALVHREPSAGVGKR